MLKQRRAAAEKVASHLFAVEAGVDAAIAQVAQLTTAMIEARSEANLSFFVSQEELVLTSRAAALMLEARQMILDTHKQLAQTRIEIGLREVAFGQEECPPVGAQESEGRKLRAVA